MGVLANYKQLGGADSETAAITNTLAALGVNAPHTGKPFTEAMLLGIGGGLGAGYILWEFKEHNLLIVVMAFRNRWQYPVQYMTNVLERIGVRGEFKETTGRKQAAANLNDAIQAGMPVITWADRGHQPYFLLPESTKGHITQIVNVVGLDDQTAWIDDLGAKPFTMPVDLLADSRNRIGSSKNRTLTLHPNLNAPIDLKAAITMGIHDQIEHLSEKSDSFSLPTFRKLGKTMIDGKNEKGWLKVFADGSGVYSALKSMYESIRLSGNSGDGLRSLYADFLTEAAGVMGNAALNETADCYRALSSQWISFADALLPDSIESFRQAKTLMNTAHKRLMTQGDAGVEANRADVAALDAIRKQWKTEFPMSQLERIAFLESLSEQMFTLYDAEVNALNSLKQVMG